MQNFCDKCNVTIDNSRTHCPLCGRCVNDAKKESSNSSYPNYKNVMDKRQFTLKALAFLIIIACAISLISEFIFTNKLNFSIYFLVCSLFVLLSIIYPLYRNWGLAGHTSWLYILFCGLIIFIEFRSQSFGWGLNYVIPLAIVALNLNNIFQLIFKALYRWDYLVPLIVLNIISLTLLIITYCYNFVIWPSVVAFFSSLFILLMLIFFKFKKTSKEIKKSFHI